MYNVYYRVIAGAEVVQKIMPSASSPPSPELFFFVLKAILGRKIQPLHSPTIEEETGPKRLRHLSKMTQKISGRCSLLACFPLRILCGITLVMCSEPLLCPKALHWVLGREHPEGQGRPHRHWYH